MSSIFRLLDVPQQQVANDKVNGDFLLQVNICRPVTAPQGTNDEISTIRKKTIRKKTIVRNFTRSVSTQQTVLQTQFHTSQRAKTCIEEKEKKNQTNLPIQTQRQPNIRINIVMSPPQINLNLMLPTRSSINPLRSTSSTSSLKNPTRNQSIGSSRHSPNQRQIDLLRMRFLYCRDMAYKIDLGSIFLFVILLILLILLTPFALLDSKTS